MSDDDDSRRLLQEAYDDGCRRCDADLRQFVTPLEAWMDELLAKPLEPNWRDQLNEYLAEQEPKGYRIEPEHRWVLEEEILLQDRDRRILAASNINGSVPSRVSLLAQRAAPAPQEKTEPKPSKTDEQEREFRWFAREASKYEQRRLQLTDDERAEYERYLVEAQRRLAKGEPPIPTPDFYREKCLRAEEEQAEADRNTPSIKASELSDLEWEIQHIIGKLSQRDRLTEAEFQSLLTRLRIMQRQLYQSTGDWNFFTRMMDSLLNPAWDGIGTLNDILLGAGGFAGGVPPGVGSPESIAGITSEGGRYLAENWHQGTFPTITQSIRYHLAKHGKGRTAMQYTQDAMSYFRKNRHLGDTVVLKDGSAGIRIQTKVTVPSQKPRKIGGYWTSDGRLVTFWD